ncbi:MAG: hypothetical protein IT439_12770 [Phycisphaerales bacterium]|nr:hypothetical protein [Phycisphaerales bacterium]
MAEEKKVAGARAGKAASFGSFAVVALVVGATGGMAWWSVRAGAEARRDQRFQAARDGARVLAEASRPLLEAGDLGSLRSLVMSAGASADVGEASVRDAAGAVLAHSLASAIDADLGEDAPRVVMHNDESALVRRVVAAGKTYWVMVSPRAESAAALGPRWAMGAGVIGCAALAGLGVVLGGQERRMRAARGLRAALLDSESEGVARWRRIGPAKDPLAQAWNALANCLERAGDGAAPGAVPGAGDRDDSRLSAAIDAMWQGLLIVDVAGTVRHANGAAALLLRTTREGLVGSSLASKVGDASLTWLLESMSGPESLTKRSAEVMDKSGTTVRFSARAVGRGREADVLVLVDDVTSQKAAEGARHTFVSHAAHELRTPLTNVRLYVEQLQELGEADGAARAQAINVINQECRRLERVVADMLNTSEVEAGALRLRPDDVRLEPLFDELREDYQAQVLDKGLSMRFELPPKLPVIHADREKLCIVMHNLLGNAVKYTPSGGSVVVRVEAGESDLTMSVSDTGFGIAESERARVFERFFRSSDQRVGGVTGTGLGLAIAREIAQMHGGDITLESVLNKGSTFTLRVPVRAPVSAARRAA